MRCISAYMVKCVFLREATVGIYLKKHRSGGVVYAGGHI